MELMGLSWDRGFETGCISERTGLVERPRNIQELDLVILVGAFQLRITHHPYGNTSRAKHSVFHGTLTMHLYMGAGGIVDICQCLGDKGL